MGKAAFFNLPGAMGHINPSLGLVGELVGRGEQVIYYAGQDSADKLRALGAQPRTYQPYFDYHHNAGQATDVVEMSVIMLDLLERCVYGLREDLAKDRPDYIIYDSCCPWGKYIARALRVPAICSVTTFVPAPAVVFSDWRLGSLVARTLALGVPLVRRARRQLLDMLERLGLPYEGLFHHLFDLFKNDGDLNLVFLSRQFQASGASFPAHYKFVGASVPDGRDVDDLQLRKLTTERPWIYISLGTVHNMKADFYRACYAAFAELPYQVIMSVGRQTDIAGLGACPANFLVRNWVPQLEVLKRARLFISHGGMNSINESLYFDVPLLMVPQQIEQGYNARRIQRFGAGLTLPAERVEPAALRRMTLTILDDERYAQNARSLGAGVRAAGGYRRAAQEILTHVRHPLTRAELRKIA